MSNQIGKSNRENSRINYLESHIPKRENFSVGRCGQRAYVFVTGKVNKSGLVESVQASPSFYVALEQTMEETDLKNEGPVRARALR